MIRPEIGCVVKAFLRFFQQVEVFRDFDGAVAEVAAAPEGVVGDGGDGEGAHGLQARTEGFL